jgi:hypothetical protein
MNVEAFENIERHSVVAKVNGETYAVMYTSSTQVDALRTVGRWAANPQLSFSWHTACEMSKMIMKS